MNHALRHFRPQGLLTLAWLFTLVLATAPAQAESESSWWQRLSPNTVIGSGKLASEARPLGEFRAVALRGDIQVVLRQGSREAVEVRADDNLLALIETKLVDRAGIATLEIDTRRGSSFTTRNPIVVNVDVTSLAALSISGSGDVTGDGLKTSALRVGVTGSGDVKLTALSADELAIHVTGSGDVAIGGRASKLSVAIVGSGDVDTSRLVSDDVKVSISGSGDAKVEADKTLTVNISGSGDVRYAGNAAVKSSIAGSGSVNKH